ncbi:MAG: hypothetical protein QXV15_05515 [Acidilobaceae archaeon]
MSGCITRAKSFLKLKKKGLTNGEYPEVRSISIWLDDRLWKLDVYTSVRISSHKDLVNVDINTHKQFWRYVNSVWRLRSKCRVKLSRGERRGSGFIAGDIFSYHLLNPWLHRPQSPISSGPMS